MVFEFWFLLLFSKFLKSQKFLKKIQKTDLRTKQKRSKLKKKHEIKIEKKTQTNIWIA